MVIVEFSSTADPVMTDTTGRGDIFNKLWNFLNNHPWFSRSGGGIILDLLSRRRANPKPDKNRKKQNRQ